jgi:hypothetical protein
MLKSSTVTHIDMIKEQQFNAETPEQAEHIATAHSENGQSCRDVSKFKIA